MNVAMAQVILGLLPTVTSGAKHLWNFVNEVRAAAKQSGEWNAEAERAYQQRLLDTAKDPVWQPDSQN